MGGNPCVIAQAKVAVTTETFGLVVIEPLLDVRTHFRVANGAGEVKPNQPFWMLARTFARTPMHLPKHGGWDGEEEPFSYHGASRRDGTRCSEIFVH